MSEPVWPQALYSDLHPVCPPETGIMVTAILQMKNGKPEQLSDLFKIIQLLKRRPGTQSQVSVQFSSFSLNPGAGGQTIE